MILKMVKQFRTVGTSLDPELHSKFMEICKKQDCKPYKVLKDLIEDLVDSYEGIKDESRKEGGTKEAYDGGSSKSDSEDSGGDSGRAAKPAAETSKREDGSILEILQG